MKMNISGIYRFFIAVFFVVAVVACQEDPHYMLTKKWQMENEDFTLDIRADSSYIVLEKNKSPQVGSWRLSPNADNIYFKQKNMDPVAMQIDTLTPARLVINNNGEAMIFKAAK
jgi:hypothetical protein